MNNECCILVNFDERASINFTEQDQAFDANETFKTIGAMTLPRL